MHARGAGRSRPAGAALLLACLLGGLPPGQGRRACGGCGLAPRHRHTVADGLRLLATPPLGGLRLRGGGSEGGEAAAEDRDDLAVDVSYWHEVGPRMLKTVKDLMRAIEKLLDHSAAQLRALHAALAARGDELRALHAAASEAAAAAAAPDAAGAVHAEDAIAGRLNVADRMLEVQQALLVYLGAATMLARRARWLQDTVERLERLVHGGVLMELQQHLAALAQRRQQALTHTHTHTHTRTRTHTHTHTHTHTTVTSLRLPAAFSPSFVAC